MQQSKATRGWTVLGLEQQAHSARWTLLICCALMCMTVIWVSQPCNVTWQTNLSSPAKSLAVPEPAGSHTSAPLANLRPQGISGLLSTALPNATGPFSLGHVLEQAVAPFRPTVLRTKTTPPFWLAVYRAAEGQKEAGPDGTWEALAGSIFVNGIWEGEETNLFYLVLTNQCKYGAGLVIDVGGFVGYFTLLSAMMGCRVHVWEGSPQHASMIHMSVWLNGMSERVTIHNNICGMGSEPMAYAAAGMGGHVAGSFLNSDNPEFQKHLGKGKYASHTSKGNQVYPLAIDDIIQEEVLLMKVDVEGYEPQVFRSAQRLLQRQLVRYVVFEYNMWRAMSKTEGVQLVMDIISWGYSVYTVPFARCKSEHIATRQQIEDISVKLMNNTYECAKFDTYLLAVRKDMPHLYEL